MSYPTHRFRFIAALILALIIAPARAGEEPVPGPIPAQVLRVVDGDTIEVRARIWLGLEVTTLVRLEGVDAPELHGKCPTERAQALHAKAFLTERIGAGPVILTEVRADKYGERVRARVASNDGADLADLLISTGFARAYFGAARAGWCNRD
ncbi:MAG: nuclease [Alphaproteobacteria bacterium]|nr:nuclease [Alphaproteobacteria bacterium]